MNQLIRPTAVLLLVLILAAGTSSAAVVYTDVEDTPFHTWIDFDLDQNSSSDVALSWYYDDWMDETTATAAVPYNAAPDNGFAQSGYQALKMEKDQVIGQALSFEGDVIMLSQSYDWDSGGYSTWGNWGNMGPEEFAFLGFQFAGDKGLHYGWFRVRVDPSTLYITLFDMAWENQAGKAILAGDMGSQVPVPSSFALFSLGLLALARTLKPRGLGQTIKLNKA